MKYGIAGGLTRAFISSPLTPLFLLASLALGLVALTALPREEEPQISVPMVDIRINANGLKAEDAVKLVTEPLETIVKSIDGVEHVYSQTEDDGAALQRCGVRCDRRRQHDLNIAALEAGLSSRGGDLALQVVDRRVAEERGDAHVAGALVDRTQGHPKVGQYVAWLGRAVGIPDPVLILIEVLFMDDQCCRGVANARLLHP